MTSFDWTVLTAGLAGAIGVGLTAMTARLRRKTRRTAEYEQVPPGGKRRRIDVVALDEGAARHDRKEEP